MDSILELYGRLGGENTRQVLSDSAVRMPSDIAVTMTIASEV